MDTAQAAQAGVRGETWALQRSGSGECNALEEEERVRSVVKSLGAELKER